MTRRSLVTVICGLDDLCRELGRQARGAISTGLRSVTALERVLAALRMVPTIEAVPIPDIGAQIDENDLFSPHSGLDVAAKAMLDEIARLRYGAHATAFRVVTGGVIASWA